MVRWLSRRSGCNQSRLAMRNNVPLLARFFLGNGRRVSDRAGDEFSEHQKCAIKGTSFLRRAACVTPVVF